jgi:TPR repeat protein
MTRVVILLLSALAMVQAQDRRLAPIRPRKQVALVIGNAAYRNRPLANPTNDARDVGARLTEIGFDTETVLDADRKQMAAAVDRFMGKLGTGDVALFYYSGHGTEIDGENYLIPVDFEGQNEVDLRYDTQAAGKIQERMERSGAQLNIIVLDACRDNPFRSSSRGSGGGLAAMNAGRGTFVAFATSPGRTASDNSTGRNGLFTQYFLQALRQPGLGLDDVFNIVRESVDQASGGKQLPWSQTGVVGRYAFVAGSAAPALETSSDPAALVARAELLYKAEDYRSAAPLFLQAAEAGNPAAMGWMGHLCEWGRGVRSDRAEAFRWYKKAADAGDPMGMMNAGRYYLTGFSVGGVFKTDYKEAEAWTRKAAEKGVPAAMEILAELYEFGYGVPQNRDQAISWYRKAAAAGDDTAGINLKTLEGTHDGTNPVEVGEERYKAKDFAAAFSAFKQGAEQGNPAAMGRLGDMLRFAQGTARDNQAALQWYKKAADKGDGHAMWSIGDMYMTTAWDLPQDLALSVEWYKKAAEAGYVSAYDSLGLAYRVGQGVPQDRDQAIFWYRKSLAAGNETTRIYLKELGAEP